VPLTQALQLLKKDFGTMEPRDSPLGGLVDWETHIYNENIEKKEEIT